VISQSLTHEFHNFNVLFRNNPEVEVVCFTAEQIPGIADKVYPKELSGKLYPKGIPIYPESKLPELIKKFKVEEVILSYSDLAYEDVMHKASIANANGADFKLLSAPATMLPSKKKVISICAVRTGCGKSPTTRKITQILKAHGKRFVVVRHPMPYGNLSKQKIQRFETIADLKKHECTIEEMEEYEPHIRNGTIVYAGIDYEAILRSAEKEAEIVIWDGGNNDTPFFKPDLHIVVCDALRPGHEMKYYPGETNFRTADVLLINKESQSNKESIDIILENAKKFNPKATIIHADSILTIDNLDKIKGKKIIVVEDGPTVTHGGMGYGAGFVAVKNSGATILNAKKFAVGSIAETYKKYPHLDKILPAMGYSSKQIKDLEDTIKRAKPDFVVSGTPIDLARIVKVGIRRIPPKTQCGILSVKLTSSRCEQFDIPILRVIYSTQEKNIQLEEILKKKGFI